MRQLRIRKALYPLATSGAALGPSNGGLRSNWNDIPQILFREEHRKRRGLYHFMAGNVPPILAHPSLTCDFSISSILFCFVLLSRRLVGATLKNKIKRE